VALFALNKTQGQHQTGKEKNRRKTGDLSSKDEYLRVDPWK